MYGTEWGLQSIVLLEGEGLFSVDGEAAPLRAGERVQWPAHRPHRLWTEATAMLTLMVAHPGAGVGP